MAQLRLGYNVQANRWVRFQPEAGSLGSLFHSSFNHPLPRFCDRFLLQMLQIHPSICTTIHPSILPSIHSKGAVSTLSTASMFNPATGFNPRCCHVRRKFHLGHKCHSLPYSGPSLAIKPYLGESDVKFSSIHPCGFCLLARQAISLQIWFLFS